MNSTREGYHWTPSTGLQQGLPCVGVFQPPQKIVHDAFDAIIIGAGYTGLTAARDLTTAGFRVLLLESRDRIGGRTWTSNIDGYNFEMGGTWVHWFQPHVYRELSRYGMKSDLVHCPDYAKGKNYYTFVTEHRKRDMSHEEEQQLTAVALGKFVNVDGNRGKTVMPFPNDQYWNKDILKYADMSIADRIEQIKHDLSEDERHAIEGVALVTSGGTRHNAAFLDFLRWWAASNYDFETFMDCLMVFKLRDGQSAFASRFFREALDTGNLSYSFNTTVQSVEALADAAVKVHVTGAPSSSFAAQRMICTIPLNVLDKVQFTPPLEAGKVEAASLKHVNQCAKVHAEVKDPGMRSWSGMNYPNNKLLLGAADGTTPSGDTHIVFFGSDQNHLQPEDDIDDTLNAIKGLTQEPVERLVFHNWSRDEFAQGTWVWYRPGMEVKYLKALQRRQGPVLFANSDWAEGAWRSFIDGAIQSGTDAALIVSRELREKERSRNVSHL